MPGSAVTSNKAKIARRVIEVLEFFDHSHREATVMDIVRRYNRPQSSTSELLSSLVDLGLLYKDCVARTYSLTPRAALLGANGQTGPARDGRLVQVIDRLAAQTGLSVAIFGLVGLKAQIISWHPGARCAPQPIRGIHGGMMRPLSETSAGWLLLSTIPSPRRDGIVRRLNAEAPDERKFAVARMAEVLETCQMGGKVTGHAGFSKGAEITACLLPQNNAQQPLAIGFVHGPEDKVNSESLLLCLDEAVRQCLSQESGHQEPIGMLQSAA